MNFATSKCGIAWMLKVNKAPWKVITPVVSAFALSRAKEMPSFSKATDYHANSNSAQLCVISNDMTDIERS